MPHPSGPDPHLTADTTFAVVPTWVLERASSRAVHLYGLLRRYADGDGLAWPSRATLAERLRCSLDTVDRAIANLIAVEALTVEHRWGADGAPTSNLYRLRVLPPQPVHNPVDDRGGVAATVRPGSRTRAEGVAATVRPKREPLNDSQRTDPPYPPAAAGGGCSIHGDSPVQNRRCCGTTARQRAEREAPAASRRPAWCGSCDERTRLVSPDGPIVSRCPACHPLEVPAWDRS